MIEVVHYLLHTIGLCPEIIGFGLSHTPTTVIHFIITYIRIKFSL